MTPDRTPPIRPRGNSPLDLLALVVIVAAPITLVLIGNANAAVIAAAGGLIIGTLRIWRSPRPR